jgi:hypothetical protein
MRARLGRCMILRPICPNSLKSRLTHGESTVSRAAETAALFVNQTRPTLDSLDKSMHKHADGSVDIYIGPKALDGQVSIAVGVR